MRMRGAETVAFHVSRSYLYWNRIPDLETCDSILMLYFFKKKLKKIVILLVLE